MYVLIEPIDQGHQNSLSIKVNQMPTIEEIESRENESCEDTRKMIVSTVNQALQKSILPSVKRENVLNGLNQIFKMKNTFINMCRHELDIEFPKDIVIDGQPQDLDNDDVELGLKTLLDQYCTLQEHLIVAMYLMAIIEEDSTLSGCSSEVKLLEDYKRAIQLSRIEMLDRLRIKALLDKTEDTGST